VLRSIAGILAGANHMPWRQFLLGNALGALAWASIFGFAAYILGRQVERVAGPMVIAIGVVALILIVIAVIFVGRREAQLMTGEHV
jgi:membrane protein DedA with SNARE-associated domain